MSENPDWQNEKVVLAETELNEKIDQDNSNEPAHFFGSDQSKYSKKNGNEYKEVSPLKTIFGTLVIIAVAWFLIAGFVNDIRYLQILGLSVVGLVILSLIISLFRPGRVNFWSLWILGDLIEVLIYIIALIVRIAFEIISNK